MKKELIILIITLCCFSFLLGVYIGINSVIKYEVKIINRLIELNKINITINEEMLNNAIFQYRNNIGGCLFIEENASIFYEPRNEVA